MTEQRIPVPDPDPAKVAQVASAPLIRRFVPPSLRPDQSMGNTRQLPTMPIHGLKTRACMSLDRDVYAAVAHRALELRLSISACVNYALAQWIGKTSVRLDDPHAKDPAMDCAPGKEKGAA